MCCRSTSAGDGLQARSDCSSQEDSALQLPEPDSEQQAKHLDQPLSRSESSSASNCQHMGGTNGFGLHEKARQNLDTRLQNQMLRAAATEMQARIDALEYQLTSEQGKAFRAAQELDRLESDLNILRSVKGDRMSIQGRLASMADTLAGTHKELIGAMQQRNALKSLLKIHHTGGWRPDIHCKPNQVCSSQDHPQPVLPMLNCQPVAGASFSEDLPDTSTQSIPSPGA